MMWAPRFPQKWKQMSRESHEDLEEMKTHSTVMLLLLCFSGENKSIGNLFKSRSHDNVKQEAQLMLTTGSTRLAVSRGQQTWYHSTCNI